MAKAADLATIADATISKDAEEESLSRTRLEIDLATTSGKSSQPQCWNCNCEMTQNHQCDEVSKVTPLGPTQKCAAAQSLAAAEQQFSEFRLRWITRLEKSTDDWTLKTKLLESLEDAFLAPVSVLSDGDFNEVKDKFFEGVFSPVRFLEELQKLLSKN